MRCGVFTAKTAKDIKFPAFIQLKADGTYREMRVENGKAEFVSRTGEQYEYTIDFPYSDLPDGHYMGEMLVSGTQNRAESNGLLNSDNPPMDRIVFQVWDYVTPEEYVNALRKVKNTTPYKKRFEKLKEIVSGVGHKQLQIIESHIVNSIQEAFEKVTGWMEQDLEGGILKDVNGVFKDGTSKHQLKMKLEMSIDVRVTGFKEGRIGTKREKTFGAIEYKTDDDKIKGSCSGFSDEQLEQINNNRDWYIGKIIAVGCNDITKGRDNDYYALSHPRFDEVRTDKTETDTLERALEIKQMAMSFS
jgi:DNA ligase-1